MLQVRDGSAAAAKHSKWSRGTASNRGECQDQITEGIVTRLGRNRKGRLRCAESGPVPRRGTRQKKNRSSRRLEREDREPLPTYLDGVKAQASRCRLSGFSKCPLSGCEAGIRRQITRPYWSKKSQLSRRAPLPRANFGRYDLVVGRGTCP